MNQSTKPKTELDVEKVYQTYLERTGSKDNQSGFRTFYQVFLDYLTGKDTESRTFYNKNQEVDRISTFLEPDCLSEFYQSL